MIIFFIWICSVAMSLSNTKKNSSFNFLILIIWEDQHVLVITCGVKVMINEFFFYIVQLSIIIKFFFWIDVSCRYGFFLDQVLRILMLKEWTKIIVSWFISFSEIFIIINIFWLLFKPKFNFFVLEHLLFICTNKGFYVAHFMSRKFVIVYLVLSIW